jgi:hypothetical protein
MNRTKILYGMDHHAIAKNPIVISMSEAIDLLSERTYDYLDRIIVLEAKVKEIDMLLHPSKTILPLPERTPLSKYPIEPEIEPYTKQDGSAIHVRNEQ